MRRDCKSCGGVGGGGINKETTEGRKCGRHENRKRKIRNLSKSKQTERQLKQTEHKMRRTKTVGKKGNEGFATGVVAGGCWRFLVVAVEKRDRE